VKEKKRKETMHDEKCPPLAGVEEVMMETLDAAEPMTGTMLHAILEERGYSQSVVNEHLWSLIDRGYIEMTDDGRFIKHETPMQNASCDFV